MIAVITAQALTGGLGVAYLIGGVTVAGLLHRAGRPAGAVWGAVVAWPLLLPMLETTTASPSPRGPLRQRIDAVLDALADTLHDPVASSVPWTADLRGLREALYAADARLALVDRLLVDADTSSEAGRALQQARVASEAEVGAVLHEVQQLRLQVGLATLAGGGEALTERLRELSARAATLSELG
jgi:hypothetical protein